MAKNRQNKAAWHVISPPNTNLKDAITTSAVMKKDTYPASNLAA